MKKVMTISLLFIFIYLISGCIGKKTRKNHYIRTA